MGHTFTDKRGANQELPKQIEVPAEPALPPFSLVLTPFPDGTCLKMLKREYPGDKPPVGFDQHILVNVTGDQLAITKNQTVAHLICDAVNMLFAAQLRHEQEQKDLVNLIAPTIDIPSTQN